MGVGLPTNARFHAPHDCRKLKGNDMTNPLDKATSTAPPTLGEGCLSRYDPEEMGPDDGTEFEGAAQLWKALQDAAAPDNPDSPDSPETK